MTKKSKRFLMTRAAYEPMTPRNSRSARRLVAILKDAELPSFLKLA